MISLTCTEQQVSKSRAVIVRGRALTPLIFDSLDLRAKNDSTESRQQQFGLFSNNTIQHVHDSYRFSYYLLVWSIGSRYDTFKRLPTLLSSYWPVWITLAGLIPDFLTRRAIRYLCNQRLQDISSTSLELEVEEKWKYIQGLKEAPVAIETEKANEQHYEVSSKSIIALQYLLTDTYDGGYARSRQPSFNRV